MLEALRAPGRAPPLLFTSTNKVYGGLEDVPLRRARRRYEPADDTLRARGIGEDRPLDFHSPYGCSKGAADQYVLDYARTYGLRTVVFRMSCIYGPHQFGNEDQGWVAHFLHPRPGRPAAHPLRRRHAGARRPLRRGPGGGVPARREEHRRARRPGVQHGRRPRQHRLAARAGRPHRRAPRPPAGGALEDWRTGDQRYYVSDVAKFAAATGWSPRVNARQGVGNLYTWLRESRGPAEAPVEAPAMVEMHAP